MADHLTLWIMLTLVALIIAFCLSEYFPTRRETVASPWASFQGVISCGPSSRPSCATPQARI